MFQLFNKTLHDPDLPHLGIVTDPMAMASVFARNLNATLAKRYWQIENCAIERVQYHWGKSRHCRLLYRVNLQDALGKKFNQWFWSELLSNGRAHRKFEAALDSPCLQNGVWQPVQFWPELNMIVWSFPNDPEMPGLVKAADPDFVQAQVNGHLSTWGLQDDWRCEETALQRVKYMPGKRCVLRYHVRLIDSSGENRRLSFYSKTYRDTAGELHYQILQKVYEHLGGHINIPRPLLYMNEACTFWQEPWEGRPIMEVLNDLDWNVLFPHLAAVLSAFHQSECPDLPFAGHWDEVLDSAQEDAAKLGWFFPQYRSRLSNALTILTAAKAGLAQHPIPQVPIHGAIRLEQIVTRRNEVALVDFDAAGLGDPLYDVAEFLVSLQYLQFNYDFSHRLAHAAELFKRSYQKQVPWDLNPQRLAWYSVAFLMAKMIGSLKHLDRCALQKFDSLLEIMEGWLKLLR
jgi:hypothetical protein